MHQARLRAHGSATVRSAVFAFLLLVGDGVLGTVKLHRTRPGELTQVETAERPMLLAEPMTAVLDDYTDYLRKRLPRSEQFDPKPLRRSLAFLGQSVMSTSREPTSAAIWSTGRPWRKARARSNANAVGKAWPVCSLIIPNGPAPEIEQRQQRRPATAARPARRSLPTEAFASSSGSLISAARSARHRPVRQSSVGRRRSTNRKCPNRSLSGSVRPCGTRPRPSSDTHAGIHSGVRHQGQ